MDYHFKGSYMHIVYLLLYESPDFDKNCEQENVDKNEYFSCTNRLLREKIVFT